MATFAPSSGSSVISRTSPAVSGELGSCDRRCEDRVGLGAHQGLVRGPDNALGNGRQWRRHSEQDNSEREYSR